MIVQQREPTIAQLEVKIIQDVSIEKLAAHMNSSFPAFTKKWEPFAVSELELSVPRRFIQERESICQTPEIGISVWCMW